MAVVVTYCQLFQGSVLRRSFVVFVLHNDLPERVSSHCHLYADDVLLYRSIESEDDKV